MKDIGSIAKNGSAAAMAIHQCDICIVGNGAVGKSAALGLAQAGFRVVLLGAPDPASTAASVSAVA